MKTVVVLSGKGGTGKTSVTAALLPFLPNAVLADADVDASNLPLLVGARHLRSEDFYGARRSRIDPQLCDGCGRCLEHCRFSALSLPADSIDGVPEVDPLACEGSGVCGLVCPRDAIALHEIVTGQWFLSESDYGPLSHARLDPGGDNSGALVEKVRREAAKLARTEGRNLVLVDGPPGIGCPAISALTGVDYALLVTEPTPAGESDFDRIFGLTRHFGIPAGVVINKADLNPSRAEALAKRIVEKGSRVLARLPYSDDVREAIREARVLSSLPGPWRQRFEELWNEMQEALQS